MNTLVAVRPATVEDAGPLAALYRDNREYLAPFEPTRGEEFFTEPGQAARLATLLAEQEQGRAYPYVIEVDGRMVGRASGYLRINGRWRDHLLFQRLSDDPAGRGSRC